MGGSRRSALGRRNGLRPSSLGGAVIALLGEPGIQPGIQLGIQLGMLDGLIGTGVSIGPGVGNALAAYALGSWLFRQILG
jgi:hypothetical protein